MDVESPAGRALTPSAAGRRDGGGRLVEAALPGLVYLAGQALVVATVAAVALARGRDPWGWLHAWDGAIFLRIARQGYRGLLPGHRSPYAFFPGYPLAVTLTHQITALPWTLAGTCVSLTAGVAATYGLQALTVQVGGSRRLAVVLVVLAATGPASVVLAMTYSEALFIALAVWTLVLLGRRAVTPAAVLCAIAGLVRVTGVALVAAVIVALLAEVAQGPADGRLTLRRTRDVMTAALVAPLGVLGYLAVVGWRTRDLLGWFALQSRGWGTHWDAGRSSAGHAAAALTHQPWGPQLAPVALGAAAVVLLAALLAQRRPWPLIAYAACIAVMDYGSAGYWTSKARLLLPAVPLLMPLATALAATPGRSRGMQRAGLVALTAWIAVGMAYSAWAVDVWPHAL